MLPSAYQPPRAASSARPTSVSDVVLIPTSDNDRSHARLASQASALALATCTLADVAAAVRRGVAAIGQDANERYGTCKVFLAAAHAALRGEGAVNLEAFKRRMVAAHRAGLLVLARADLVAAMPRATVAASEVSEDGAEFHFVLDEAARDPWGDDAGSPEPSQGGWSSCAGSHLELRAMSSARWTTSAIRSHVPMPCYMPPTICSSESVMIASAANTWPTWSTSRSR